ncbi:MAG: hypothetical protein QOK36_663, partial [Gaiellales bacterium]|nr:hypothetical protein [Gaiellales bacterium]
MVAVARIGVLAVAGIAAAAVAIPHLVSASTAPVPPSGTPIVPVGVHEMPTRQLHVPPPQRRRPRPKLALEADHLPKLAPYSLPPRLILRS